MANSLLKNYVLPAAIIIAGIAAATALSDSLERGRPALPVGYSDTDLRVIGSRMKGFTLGMEGLIADWYYMRSLQYIGDKVLASKSNFIDLDDLRSLNPRLLYPLLDTATDLDPHFVAAYSYGAVVLPAIDGEQAIRLTQKGIENNPATWQLYQHLGYIYWRLGRYDEAADAYARGTDIPGAAPFMRLMVGAMKTEGGSRATARQIFEQMYHGTTDPAVRLTAERRLARLDELDQREAIDTVLSDFKTRTGRCATSLSEVWPTLARVKLPGNNTFKADASNRLADPSGVPYVLDTENCRLQPSAKK